MALGIADFIGVTDFEHRLKIGRDLGLAAKTRPVIGELTGI